VARIIGGIGTSHVPTIGLAVDRGKQHDPHGLIAPENRALFRELLHAREARARERRVQPRDGRRDARRAAGGVSQKTRNVPGAR
jgi:hypothetical protein